MSKNVATDLIIRGVSIRESINLMNEAITPDKKDIERVQGWNDNVAAIKDLNKLARRIVAAAQYAPQNMQRYIDRYKEISGGTIDPELKNYIDNGATDLKVSEKDIFDALVAADTKYTFLHPYIKLYGSSWGDSSFYVKDGRMDISMCIDIVSGETGAKDDYKFSYHDWKEGEFEDSVNVSPSDPDKVGTITKAISGNFTKFLDKLYPLFIEEVESYSESLDSRYNIKVTIKYDYSSKKFTVSGDVSGEATLDNVLTKGTAAFKSLVKKVRSGRTKYTRDDLDASIAKVLSKYTIDTQKGWYYERGQQNYSLTHVVEFPNGYKNQFEYYYNEESGEVAIRYSRLDRMDDDGSTYCDDLPSAEKALKDLVDKISSLPALVEPNDLVVLIKNQFGSKVRVKAENRAHTVYRVAFEIRGFDREFYASYISGKIYESRYSRSEENLCSLTDDGVQEYLDSINSAIPEGFTKTKFDKSDVQKFDAVCKKSGWEYTTISADRRNIVLMKVKGDRDHRVYIEVTDGDFKVKGVLYGMVTTPIYTKDCTYDEIEKYIPEAIKAVESEEL